MIGVTISKPNKLVINVLLISFFGLIALESSEARRMGGGRSFGKMPPIKRQVTPPPKKPNSVNNKKAVDANSGAKKFGGMGLLGGLAAGLGLAALASFLGIGEELMGLIAIFGILLLCFIAYRAFVSRGLTRMVMAGAQSGGASRGFVDGKTEIPSSKVNQGMQSKEPYYEWEITDEAKFLEVAKSKFIELQQHWSSGNLTKLENFCTDELMNHLTNEYRKNDKTSSNLSVVELNASLEGSRIKTIESGENAVEVYIRFAGFMRESESTPTMFNEIWTLRRALSTDEGWLVTGIFQDGELR
tara:strand:- start:215 stop:1117 length:903 start_codon:yes stop_codon:yes gene_type:complete